jgi:hypothetical protein
MLSPGDLNFENQRGLKDATAAHRLISNEPEKYLFRQESG